jgi:hypothetical protein
MKHTELYFAIQNYIFFGMLILLAIGIAMFLIGTVVYKIKSGFDKYIQKKIDEECEEEDDEKMHRELNPIKDYPPYLDRPKGVSNNENNISP